MNERAHLIGLDHGRVFGSMASHIPYPDTDMIESNLVLAVFARQAWRLELPGPRQHLASEMMWVTQVPLT